MPGFGQIFSKADNDAVHAFVIERSRIAFEPQAGQGIARVSRPVLLR